MIDEKLQPKRTSVYDKAFFEDLKIGATESAEAVVPIVFEKLKPRSVLDVGCGMGSWLKIWSQYGTDIFGVDGNWVNKDEIQIPQEKFRNIELNDTFNLERRFDLVVTLEVAEHLHEKSAKKFVKSLVNHGDLILFSAAIPWQGGTDHFNEQWPEYWIELFKAEGYTFLDPFRHLIWNHGVIKYHYRQNMILFAKDNIFANNKFLEQELMYAKRSLISVVHPEKFIRTRDPKHRSLRQELPDFIQLIKNWILKLVK